jgi:cytochrome c peroxidase
MNSRKTLFLFVFSIFLFVWGCRNNSNKKEQESDESLLRIARTVFRYDPQGPFHQISDEPDPEELLGQMLYHDTRLSKSGFISCNTCHNIATYGADRLPVSPGHKWILGTRNSPTTLNAFLHASQFWDGRDKTIEEQAIGPILNPIEMAIPDEEELIAVLNSVPAYVDLFAKVYPGDKPISMKHVANAIGAFERRMVTPAPIHTYLAGDIGTLSISQLKGLEDFISIGCATCHLNETLGGMSFARFFPEGFPQILDPSDKGRYEVTGDPGDEYFFKVPSLLNIVHTYPYFHNGGVWELKEAIRIIAATQLELDLQEDQLESLLHFMTALTGDISDDLLKLPVLPPSKKFYHHPDLNESGESM